MIWSRCQSARVSNDTSYILVSSLLGELVDGLLPLALGIDRDAVVDDTQVAECFNRHRLARVVLEALIATEKRSAKRQRKIQRTEARRRSKPSWL